MDEQCKIHTEKIKEIGDDTKQILKLLNGNGTLGIVAKVENHDTYINGQIKNKTGIMTFAFRFVLSIAIGYIAVKLGLK